MLSLEIWCLEMASGAIFGPRLPLQNFPFVLRFWFTSHPHAWRLVSISIDVFGLKCPICPMTSLDIQGSPEQVSVAGLRCPIIGKSKGYPDMVFEHHQSHVQDFPSALGLLMITKGFPYMVYEYHLKCPIYLWTLKGCPWHGLWISSILSPRCFISHKYITCRGGGAGLADPATI